MAEPEPTEPITGAGLRDSTVCVLVSASRFTVRRSVKGDRAEVKSTGTRDPDQDMVAVAKDLLDSEQLRLIANHDNASRAWLRDKAAPNPVFVRAGAYLFGVDGLKEAYEYLEAQKTARVPLEGAFLAAYPDLVKAARRRLGDLFDPAQYPPVEKVGELFTFSWQVVEIGVPGEKLRTVSQALFDKEQRKAESVWSNAVGQINEALTRGMADVVDHLADQLGDGEGKPKRFRATAVKKVAAFLDAFVARNLTRNADLGRLVDQAKGLLAGVDAKQIRTKDDVRRQVAQGFQAIKGSLGQMLEARPSRAISLRTDEAV